MNIVVVGTIYMDVKGYPYSDYIANGRNAGYIEYIHGGVGRNVVEDISHCQIRPTFISLVDDNSLGQGVIDRLEESNTNTKYIQSVPDGMGTWMAIFDNTGDVISSISKRPDLDRINTILDKQGDEIFSKADSILLEIDIDETIVSRVFQYAEKYDVEVYALVSNMGIAMERIDYIRKTSCFICNQQEAGQLFGVDCDTVSPETMLQLLSDGIKKEQIQRMVVTMGNQGAVYVDGRTKEHGIVDAQDVKVKDTTGAGDAFFAGVSIGLTYKESLNHACEIGTKLASSVITTTENVCGEFSHEELGIHEES